MRKSKKKSATEPTVFQQEMKRDRNTFKSLDSIPKKAQYIWDYYKIPLAFAAVIIAAVIIFAHAFWEGNRPCRLRVCAVLNTEDSCYDWFLNFQDELQSDGVKGDVDLNEDQPFDYSNSYYYMYEIEVMSTVSSYRMDVAVCNADMYSYLLASNYCMDLEEALPEDFFEELSERDMLDYNTSNLAVDEDGNIHPEDGIDGCWAVNLEGSAFADTYNQTEDDEPLYAVIISNTDHLDDAITLLEALAE